MTTAHESACLFAAGAMMQAQHDGLEHQLINDTTGASVRHYAASDGSSDHIVGDDRLTHAAAFDRIVAMVTS